MAQGIPPEAITASDPAAAITEFFVLLSRHCAAGDYASMRQHVAEDVVSFGTKAAIVSGVAALQKEQWEEIWPLLTHFQVELERVHAGGAGDIAWGMAPWISGRRGVDGERPGRATVVLERRDGRWLAVHTHFSLVP